MIAWHLASAGASPAMVSALGGRLEATVSLSLRGPWTCTRCKKKSPSVHWDSDEAELAAFAAFAQAHGGKECP